MDFPTLQTLIGNTPLARLQRLPGASRNLILGKLEGNNPAGPVKDRAALGLIQQAEARGDIRPGDTLIEAPTGVSAAGALAAALQLSAERTDAVIVFIVRDRGDRYLSTGVFQD